MWHTQPCLTGRESSSHSRSSRCGAPSRCTVKEWGSYKSGCHIMNHTTKHVIVCSCSCTTSTHTHTHTNQHTRTHTHTHTRKYQDLECRVCIHPSENRDVFSPPNLYSKFSLNKQRRWERGFTIMTSEISSWTEWNLFVYYESTETVTELLFFFFSVRVFSDSIEDLLTRV